MQNKLLRLLALLMLLILPVLIISACGRGTTTYTLPDPYAPLPPSATTPPTIPPVVEHIAQDIRTLRNTSGRPITIFATDFNSVPEFALLNYPDPAISDNYLRDRLIWDNARRVEYKHDVFIEGIQSRGTTDLRGRLRLTAIAGSPVADMVFLNTSQNILEAAANNWIQPLDTISLPGSDLLGVQMYTRFVAEGLLGHSWALTAQGNSSYAFTLGVNLDIINAIGAPSPVYLYYTGGWTWDAWLDIMRMATQDTTGNGEIDQWGIFGPDSVLFRNLVAANGGRLVTDDLRCALTEPATVEAFEFMYSLVHEGLWRPTRVTIMRNNIPHRVMYTPGTAAFTTSVPWSALPSSETPYSLMPPEPHPHYEFAVVPLPRGPSNTTDSEGMESQNSGIVFTHSTSWAAKDLLTVIEEFFAWPGYNLSLLYDQQVYWGLTSIPLEGENAVRHINAAARMQVDYANYIQSHWDLMGLYMHELYTAQLAFDQRRIGHNSFLWIDHFLELFNGGWHRPAFFSQFFQQELDRFFE